MRRLKDAAGCLFVFAALVLFFVGAPFGIWQAVIAHSLALGLLMLVYVAVLAGLFLLGVWLTGATGGFWASAGARKRRIGPPPEWHMPAPPTSG